MNSSKKITKNIINKKLIIIVFFIFYLAVQPPSTNREVPVIIEDASDAKKATAVATSLVSATLPKGIFFKTSFIFWIANLILSDEIA